MRKSMLVVLILSLWAVMALADPQPKPDTSTASAALKVLRAQFPKFDWQADTAISVDINADDVDDVAVLGYTEKTAAVGVVLGQKNVGKPKALYMDFMRGDPAVERSMNGRHGTLKAWKQDETPKEAMGELPEGYRICDNCYQIEVVGDEGSDPISIYWDSVINSLNWWRP